MTEVLIVKFDGSNREYSYLSKDPSIRQGDRVIVDSPYSGYTTVTAVRRHSFLKKSSATKWIVGKVDDKQYLADAKVRKDLDRRENNWKNNQKDRIKNINKGIEAEKARIITEHTRDKTSYLYSLFARLKKTKEETYTPPKKFSEVNLVLKENNSGIGYHHWDEF